MGELLQMSHKELERHVILQRVLAKELTQKEAENLLGIKERQIRNLLGEFKVHGPKGLISRHRGKNSNRKTPDLVKQDIMSLLKGRYEGFGPTLAKEKLEELHGIKIGTETLRLWMIEGKLWIPRKQRPAVHLPRQRRPCFGELEQADGSHHRWFGDDGPMVNASVIVDDATSMLTGLYFTPTETFEGYAQALKQHLKRYGRCKALYVDHSAVCETRLGNGTTQMQRVLKELDIELIFANSPQAKGRVERMNRTLQDRLVKELQLRGIKTIEGANEYSAEFMEDFNKKFSKKPMSDYDAHRSLEGYDLERVLSRCETRILLSSGIFQYKNTMYQVQGVSDVRRLKGRHVDIRVPTEGTMRVFLADKEVKVQPLSEIIEAPELSRKEVLSWPPSSGQHTVPKTHPWKSNDRRRYNIR